MATLVMDALLLPEMTPLRGTRKERSLSYFWARLLVREVYVIFMQNHWEKINSLLHINLANPNLHSKGKYPDTQPG